jgi:predicted phosphodiesterase
MKKITTLILVLLTVFVSMGQNIKKGPYIVEPSDKEIIIRYELSGKQTYTIEYGTDKNKTTKMKLVFRESKYDAFLYDAKLIDLKPNTTYYYKLSNIENDKWRTFKTYAENQKTFSFVAMGDSRSNPDIFTKIFNLTNKENPDFIISMGDLVEDGGNYEQWQRFYFDVVKDFAGTTPLVSTLGDHEVAGDDGELFRYFLRNNEKTDKQWFSFDYGDAHFISLDFRYSDSKEMIDWFENDIEKANKKWNFVYMHRPVFNYGGHRTSWGQDVWSELFYKHKVDIVFAGHSHLYERFYPVKPNSGDKSFAVTYITTGGAGAGLYEAMSNESFLAKSESVNHFISVKIDKNSLSMKAVRMDGSLLDEFSISKDKKNNKVFGKDVVITSQEELKTVTDLNASISHRIDIIPLAIVPVNYDVELQSYIDTDIPFTIQISDTSKDNYSIESFSDTLQSMSKKKVSFDIYRKNSVSVSPWGHLKPGLYINMIYEMNNRKDTIIGIVNYWP